MTRRQERSASVGRPSLSIVLKVARVTLPRARRYRWADSCVPSRRSKNAMWSVLKHVKSSWTMMSRCQTRNVAWVWKTINQIDQRRNGCMPSEWTRSSRDLGASAVRSIIYGHQVRPADIRIFKKSYTVFCYLVVYSVSTGLLKRIFFFFSQHNTVLYFNQWVQLSECHQIQ